MSRLGTQSSLIQRQRDEIELEGRCIRINILSCKMKAAACHSSRKKKVHRTKAQEDAILASDNEFE